LLNLFGGHTSLSFSLLNNLLLPLVDFILMKLELEGELTGLVSFLDLSNNTRVGDLFIVSNKLGLLKSEIVVLSLLGISEFLVDLILS